VKRLEGRTAPITGVTVNAICPGYVNTPLTGEMVARVAERTARSYEDALTALLQQTGSTLSSPRRR